MKKIALINSKSIYMKNYNIDKLILFIRDLIVTAHHVSSKQQHPHQLCNRSLTKKLSPVTLTTQHAIYD